MFYCGLGSSPEDRQEALDALWCKLCLSQALLRLFLRSLMPSRDATLLPLTASKAARRLQILGRIDEWGQGWPSHRAAARSVLYAIHQYIDNQNKVLAGQKIHQNRSQTKNSWFMQKLRSRGCTVQCHNERVDHAPL